jgi:signal transduction histidine kinase
MCRLYRISGQDTTGVTNLFNREKHAISDLEQMARLPKCEGDFIMTHKIRFIASLELRRAVVRALARIVAHNPTDEERRELSGRLIRAQEDERSRLARELHDDFSQRLTVLAIDLARTAAIISDSPVEAIRRIHELRSRVSEIGADLHSLSHRLHSSSLEILGLILGVSSFCGDFAEQQHIQVDFAHKDVPRNIPPEVELCIFRIVQEGLRNVKRHSGATRAEVRLEAIANGLYLSIADEGVGFDMTKRSSRTGLGIRSMQERLRLLGGRAEIRSRLGQGTTVEVWVPLNPATAGTEMTQPGACELPEVAI